MDEVSDMDDLNKLLKCTLSRHCGEGWIIIVIIIIIIIIIITIIIIIIIIVIIIIISSIIINIIIVFVVIIITTTTTTTTTIYTHLADVADPRLFFLHGGGDQMEGDRSATFLLHHNLEVEIGLLNLESFSLAGAAAGGGRTVTDSAALRRERRHGRFCVCRRRKVSSCGQVR